jgi:hypothetical protein
MSEERFVDPYFLLFSVVNLKGIELSFGFLEVTFTNVSILNQ